MKRWAFLVAALYGLLIVVFSVPVLALAFGESMGKLVSIYAEWSYWVWIGVMIAGQLVLLTVPVYLSRGRPVPRGALWPTVLASGLMMAALAAGAFFAIYEFAFTIEGDFPALQWGCVFGTMLFAWAVWTLIFMRMARTVAPEDWVSRQCRALFKGSILELLIAVPTHVAARHRDQCCAGVMTFIGLVTGLSVMLFSFGPAVFFLYAARWRRLHPPAPVKS